MADTRFLKNYPAMERHQLEIQGLKRRRRWRLALGATLGLAVIIGAFIVSPPLALLLGGIVAMALFFAGIGGSSSVPEHELSGIQGELRALDQLKRLPADCTLLNRVMLDDDWLPNGERELDFIVVAPAGLFVVEVKNSAGRIHVEPDKKHWPLVGRGCGGRPNWQAVANPLPQVTAQAGALERFLLKQGLHERARPVVCFARPEVILENVDTSSIPVVVPEQLAGLIQSDSGSASLDVAQRQRILSALTAGKAKHTARAA